MLRGRKTDRLFLVAVVLLAVSLAAACGPDEEVLAAQARAEEWTALQAMQETLQQQRAEVVKLKDELAAQGEEVAEEAKAEIEKAYNNADFQVQKLTEEFNGRLVSFINDAGLEQGDELNETQLAAFRMKAREDLVIADEYGEIGGDWARAIAIAQEALRNEPTNPEVQERLAYYESMRYMTEERLAKAEVGMTLEEVKAAIGVPSRGNDREFEGGTRRAFYYLKSADRDAAAVYFRKRGDDWTVYQVDFNALEASTS